MCGIAGWLGDLTENESYPRRVVAVFPSEEFLLTGYLTALLTKKPIFLCFHNCYVENRRSISKLFTHWLQEKY